MKVYKVSDKEFEKFGKVYNIDSREIVEVASGIEMLDKGTDYVPSMEMFEALPVMKTITNECFGGLPTQLGYCYGHNDIMNALEWHKCSEINIAVTDMILILGNVCDLEKDYRYDSSKAMAFEVKKGTVIEMYSTTLHYCPIETSKDGFGCVVGLLKNTNTELDFVPDDKLMLCKNKWIIAHGDCKELADKGVLCSIYGNNHRFIID